MAEAIINARLGDQWRAFSAGTDPAGYVHPMALQTLTEIGIIHKGVSQHVDQFREMNFNVVITVCDDAAENCPMWLGSGARVHLGFVDPAKATGTEAEQCDLFCKVRDQIEDRILEYLTEY